MTEYAHSPPPGLSKVASLIVFKVIKTNCVIQTETKGICSDMNNNSIEI